MNFKTLVPTIALALLCSVPAGLCEDKADANSELKDLVAKINAKLRVGKTSESDLAPEVKEFDALFAKHKDEKTDDVAQILFMEAKLYLEVFKDADKGRDLVKQIKQELPETEVGKQADEILDSINKQAEALKIQKTLVKGASFPDFDEKDVEGNSLSVAKYKGKVVLIDFWATWCGPCVLEIPNVIKTYEKHHDQGFEIIGVSLDQDKERLTTFTKEKKMSWQQFFDGSKTGNKLAAKYGIQIIPATFLLDGEGKIIGRDLMGANLEEAVSAALPVKN